MSDHQPRKTSIPIHFHFAHSKRLTPSPREAMCNLAAPLRSKKRPPPIVVPEDTPDHQRLPAMVQTEWTPVEITNFSPQLRRAGMLELLADYNISPEFAFAVTPKFTHPFRTTVLAAGSEEARRMVNELHGKRVGGRDVSVRMVAQIDQEDKEVVARKIVDEMKTDIINTARAYYPALADAILEVHEMVQGHVHYVFLQRRIPVTVHSNTEAHALFPGLQNEESWEFVSGASFELTFEDDRDVMCFQALKNLQENLERQGLLRKIWDGSRVLTANAF